MASEVKWLVENRVLLFIYTGTVTLEDVIHATDLAINMVNSTTGIVHVINDLSNMDGIAPNMQKVGEIVNATKTFMTHDRLGVMTAHGNNSKFFRFLTSLVSQVIHAEFRMFDTYDEAIQHLIHNEPGLEDQLKKL